MTPGRKSREQFPKIKASLGYVPSSRPTRAAEQDFVSKTKRPVWVVYTCNPTTCEIELGGLPSVQDYLVTPRPARGTECDMVSNDNNKQKEWASGKQQLNAILETDASLNGIH